MTDWPDSLADARERIIALETELAEAEKDFGYCQRTLKKWMDRATKAEAEVERGNKSIAVLAESLNAEVEYRIAAEAALAEAVKERDAAWNKAIDAAQKVVCDFSNYPPPEGTRLSFRQYISDRIRALKDSQC